MTGRLRAIIARPRRRAHLATIGDGEQVWLTLCDREVPADGTAHRPHGWADDVDPMLAAGMCRTCLGLTLVAGLVAVEVAPALVAEHRALKAQLGGLLTEIDRQRREHLTAIETADAIEEHAAQRRLGAAS